VVRRFRAAARGDDACVLLDGAHLVDEALRSHVKIDVLLSDGRSAALESRARRAGATVFTATQGVLDAASPVRTSSGVVALAAWQPATLDDAMGARAACCLALVGVQDPGNTGSAIRAADALGATGVVALDGTARPHGWKTLRGAMGSTFHLPVAIGDSAEAIAEARRRGLAVIAAVAREGTPLDRARLRRPLMLLLGSEGSGLPPALEAMADERVTIPMRDGVESLNVAVTAALLLFEARRRHAEPTAVS